MRKERAERIRKRITCEFLLAGQRQRGIVLDLSETGLFVQTVAAAMPGATLLVRLRATGMDEIELDAVVARRVSVPPQLATVARGGLGLRVRNPPPIYFELLGKEVRGSGSGRAPPQAPAGEEADEGPSQPQGPARANSPHSSSGAAPQAPPTRATALFRVRAKQAGGSRSRSLRVEATSQDEAHSRARAELGGGWEILSVEAL